MTPIDFIIIGFLGYQALSGFRNGFVKIFLQVLAILISFRISMLTYPELTQLFKTHLQFSETPSVIFSFILIWLGIFLIIRVIGIVLDKLIEFSGLSIINRLGGLILGVGKGICFLIPIIIPMFMFKPTFIEYSKVLSPLTPVISTLTQHIIPTRDPILFKETE